MRIDWVECTMLHVDTQSLRAWLLSDEIMLVIASVVD